MVIDHPFNVAGISIRTSNAPGKAEKDLPALWARFSAENIGNLIPDAQSDEIYCVYTNYESDHTGEYDVILGKKIKTIVDDGNFKTVLIGAGNYEIFTATGNLAAGAVFTEWQKIWTAGLPRLFRTDFEVYGAAAADPSNGSVEIFVGVK